MNHRKLGLKALGLCLLAALSVMALAATGAKAEPGHVWVLDVNGTKVLLTETVKVQQREKATNGMLLSTFGAGETPIAIACTAILIHDGLVFPNGSGLAEILLSSCSTLISGLVKANCKPLEPVVAKVKTLPIHHNGDTYVLSSPHDSLTYETYHFGALCAAGENVQVKGSLVSECGRLEVLGGPSLFHWTHEDCNIHSAQLLSRQAPLALFPNHHLKFGTKIATLDGDLGMTPIGAHAGRPMGIEALLP